MHSGARSASDRTAAMVTSTSTAVAEGDTTGFGWRTAPVVARNGTFAPAERGRAAKPAHPKNVYGVPCADEILLHCWRDVAGSIDGMGVETLHPLSVNRLRGTGRCQLTP